MVNSKVGFGKDEMCSYKHTHNGVVHTTGNTQRQSTGVLKESFKEIEP
jgi:hypothetical protein